MSTIMRPKVRKRPIRTNGRPKMEVKMKVSSATENHVKEKISQNKSKGIMNVSLPENDSLFRHAYPLELLIPRDVGFNDILSREIWLDHG